MGLIGLLGRITTLALALAVVMLAHAAPATAAPIRPVCHGFADPGALPREWSCGATHWRPTARVAWLRFDAASWRDAPPRKLILTIGRFDRATVSAYGDRGVQWSRELHLDDFTALENGPRMAVNLPAVSPQTKSIMVRIDHTWSIHTLSGTRLDASDAPGEPWGYRAMVLLAMLAGLLCAPVIFDLAFYTALRERFLLWHAGMTTGMLTQTVMASGLAVTLFGLTPVQLAVLSPLAFAVAVAAAAFFSAEFLEPDALSPRMRLLLRLSGWWVLLVSCTLALQPPGLGALGGQTYHLSFLPTTLVFGTTMILAVRSGSRAARFQMAAWTPILACGFDRLFRGIGLYSLPMAADQAIYLAMALEVVITMLGVADRFIVLRGERDRANARAQELEAAIERDPLTGLFNRHGIEDRFAAFRNAGFDTLAVVDLDHFKAVNDAMGHAAGDCVLAAAAAALSDDPDLVAWRLGGEEFLLLLRGRNATARAEARRQAIPGRVAATIPGLPAPVTASMGLVEMQRGSMLATPYAELYARADRLLYEAKHAGRNRTCSEKVTLFAGGDRRVADRRRSARQAA
ncbi:diguanylate cyclase [Novosphingobium sp. Gsoil 351]|uniref:sensor domain-containing diguanylate cyclase n=1 Tax=Novosphingobium sp. Gsoil 351 TaxID=2675225 RepID=UPI0012B44FEB|nr:diguanylate cyclase [Novosphingobium sp. Gsoil 351]QGN54991.1 diguanylate cyclase [Novosphingobium sp. Gsoil 351]